MTLITPQQIAHLSLIHHLGSISHLEQPTHGIMNSVWIVNHAYVLRVDTRTPPEERSRFVGEALAYRLLREIGLPVPHLITVDESRQHLPFPYLIVSRIPGQTLVECWGNPQDSMLAEQAGSLLAHIHDITFPRFGPLMVEVDRAQPNYTHWRNYVQAYFERAAHPTLTAGLITPAQYDQITLHLRQMRASLDRLRFGHLVHGDYHAENLLTAEGHITGVLDFEWAISGDPVWDFVLLEEWEATAPGSSAAFLGGYMAVRPLDKDHARRLHLYNVLRNLTHLLDAHHQNDPAGIDWYRSHISAALSQVPKA
jgi:aminoglycoside phosphotransferase (APT) family kinase protein